MTSNKNHPIGLTVLVFLVCLHTAHAHYVPCTTESPGKAITDVMTTIQTDTTTGKDTTTSVDSTITAATEITRNSDNAAGIDTTTIAVIIIDTDADIDVAAGVDTSVHTTTGIDSTTARNAANTAGIDTTTTIISGIDLTTSFDTAVGFDITTSIYTSTVIDYTTTTETDIKTNSDNISDMDTTSTTKSGTDLTIGTSVDIATGVYTIAGIDSTPTTVIDFTRNFDKTAVIDATTTIVSDTTSQSNITTSTDITTTTNTDRIRHANNTSGIDTTATTTTVADTTSQSNSPTITDITTTTITDTTRHTNNTSGIDTTAATTTVADTTSQSDIPTNTDITTTTITDTTRHTNNTSGIDTTATTTTVADTTSQSDSPTNTDITTTAITDTTRHTNNTSGIDTTATTTTVADTTSQSNITTSTDITTTTITDTTRHTNNTSGIDTTATTLTTSRTTATSDTGITTSLTTSSTDIIATSESSIINTTIPPNLYSPVFYEDIYYGDVYEDVPVGTVLLTVQALDWDQGGGGEIIYNIFSGEGDAEDWADFAVHPVTGVVAVVGKLDREKKGVYTINITAEDQGEPAKSAVALLEVIILDVNDNAPVFDQSRYEAVIDEDAHLMSRLLHVAATDADLGTNSEVTYSLSGNHKNTFTIDKRSGLIRTRRSLDRERVAQYSFRVTAIDHGAPALRGTVEVLVRIGDVNDNPPKFPGSTVDLNITENNMPFSPIGKVTAIDADEGPNAVVSYAFVQRVAQNRFQIERRTGIVHTLYRFDREQRSEYEVVVRASSGRLFTDARLVIHIQDVNDNPPMVPATQEIVYIFYAGYGCNAIGKVGALDKDSGDSLKFRLLAGSKVSPEVAETRIHSSNPSENETVIVFGMRFAVDRNTGMLRACHRPSSHIPPSVQLTVVVSDGLHSKTCFCTIYLSRVTDQSLRSSMSLRLHIRADVKNVLVRLREFISAVAAIFRTSEELVTLLIRGGLTEPHGANKSSQVLMTRGMLAVGRRDGTVVAPDQLRSMVYLELEQLQVFADIVLDPARPHQCRLVPTVVGGASVVTEVALGMTYTYFNASFKASCEKNTGFCGSETCEKFEECVGENDENGDGLGCRCLFSGDTNCQPPFPAGNCPEAVCNHRGSCVVDDAGEVGCLCRDHGRYDGPRCQMTTRSFTDGSFLAFMPLGRLSRDFYITLRFKTSKSSGLLLYNGQLSGKGESIALQIVGSHLQFRKSGRVGANSAGTSASIATDVSDGRWHDVYVNHVGGNVLMGIDNCTGTAATWSVTDADPTCLGIGIKRKTPRAKFLNLSGPLFLGGLPSSVTTSQVTATHFEGCLNAVEFDSTVLDFSKRLKNVGTTPRCNERSDPAKTATPKVKAPRPVRSLSVRPRMRTLVIKWIPPKDKSGQVIGYQISYVTVNETEDPLSVIKTVIINSPSETSYTIERLTPDTRYQITIRAFSAAGFGESVTVFTKTKNSKAIK